MMARMSDRWKGMAPLVRYINPTNVRLAGVALAFISMFLAWEVMQSDMPGPHVGDEHDLFTIGDRLRTDLTRYGQELFVLGTFLAIGTRWGAMLQAIGLVMLAFYIPQVYSPNFTIVYGYATYYTVIGYGFYVGWAAVAVESFSSHVDRLVFSRCVDGTALHR